jgi:hypothetical protein
VIYTPPPYRRHFPLTLVYLCRFSHTKESFKVGIRCGGGRHKPFVDRQLKEDVSIQFSSVVGILMIMYQPYGLKLLIIHGAEQVIA